MFAVINYSEALYPLIMVFLALLTLILNFFLAKKSNERFKRKEMDKKADVIYVDKRIDEVNKDINTQINHTNEVFKNANEETKALIENMARQVNFIYQKHYKP